MKKLFESQGSCGHGFFPNGCDYCKAEQFKLQLKESRNFFSRMENGTVQVILGGQAAPRRINIPVEDLYRHFAVRVIDEMDELMTTQFRRIWDTQR